MPKVLQSDPKGLQNGALGGHLGDFFCKKPTLHPTAYLLCFRHILEVLASPVLRKFLLEMCVGSRSPKKAITLSLFLIFRRKCVKMGAQMGGGISPQNCSFLLGFLDPLPGFLDPPPLGVSHPYLTRISPISHIFDVFSTMGEILLRY